MTKIPFAALALALSLGACANDPTPSTDNTVAAARGSDAAANAAEEAEDGDEADEDGDEADAVVPPAAVADAFKAAHPAATDVAWTMEGGGFEAFFKDGGTSTSIVYSAAGVAGAVETEIAVADLPPAVTAALARDYAGKTVSETARIVENGQTSYEAEITVDGKKLDLVFREDGSLVETKPEDAK